MLPAFRGRVNRKTFLLGNVIGLSVLGFAVLIYIVPVAVIDIIVKGSSGPGAIIFKILYGLFLIPALFYFFFFSVLFVKRMHDIGYPGMLLLWAFIIFEGLARVADIWLLNVLGLLILLAACALPGRKGSNNFGPAPSRKFRIRELVIKF